MDRWKDGNEKPRLSLFLGLFISYMNRQENWRKNDVLFDKYLALLRKVRPGLQGCEPEYQNLWELMLELQEDGDLRPDRKADIIELGAAVYSHQRQKIGQDVTP